MLRFAALTWNAQDRLQAQAVSRLESRLLRGEERWRTAFKKEGMHVIVPEAAAPGTTILPEDAGILIGTIFRRQLDGNEPKATFAPTGNDVRAIMDSCGRALVEQCWGRYVAFLWRARDGVRWVIRDPTGGVECLTCTVGGIRIFFSYMPDFVRLGACNLSINWDHVITHVGLRYSDTRDTGLQEVTRVLGGEAWQIREDGIISQTFYWHPANFVGDSRTTATVRTLRTITRYCVDAWASRYGRILLLLSGGLDSSVVLSCLSEHAQSVTCLNYYYPPSMASEERAYARLAAERAGAPLIEVESQAQVTIEKIVDFPAWHQPYDAARELATASALCSTARHLGAGAIFSGLGGDQLFFQQAPRYACSDYISDHGLRFGVLPRAIDAALFGRVSIWRALATALHEGFRSDPSGLIRSSFMLSKLARPEVRDSVMAKAFIHPWLIDMPRIPLGKYWHIWCLSRPNALHNPFAATDDPDEVFPLLSQPIIELCLSTPTYVLSTNGVDRSLVRDAFANDIPAEVARRRSKSIVDRYFDDLLRSNLDFVRSLLLDGRLVAERILDRQLLEHALMNRVRSGFGYASEILRFVALEAWLSFWYRSGRQGAL